MTILRDVLGGLVKMFVGDAWLSLGILAVVAVAALVAQSRAVTSIVGGAALLLGCIGVLLASLMAERRKRRRR